ncbi:hypothetical protein BDV38DRAFT_245915 [Aspergillus pseudotamarii]|uniref:BTB domain-containing protein n=1 Tax=Aspergillus pseudotamarii TaxID=132259 RepID=A0A5N6SVS7_ASPPS|nr:uncharacterized protein BDV38DRAFT_245915 [Aspergillus pseudotamarii]KAE8137929.1 hypothetical protein BDV38DRAFT_245915 [Aspergillus pseudotamarii]
MPRRKLLPCGPKKSVQNEAQDTIPGRELLEALASLRCNPVYSDLTILCGQESYPVHKCIVCTRSDFFAKACDGKFKEASTREVILNEEPALVKQMIEYFYTLEYQVNTEFQAPDGQSFDQKNITSPPRWEGTETPLAHAGSVEPVESNQVCDVPEEQARLSDPLSFHILMYSLADRLLIHGLKALSKENAGHELIQRLDAHAFPQAIFEIYNSTPENDRGLRDLAVEVTMDHLSALRKANGTAAAAFKDDLLKSVPQFSYDLVVAMMNKSVSTESRWGM